MTDVEHHLQDVIAEVIGFRPEFTDEVKNADFYDSAFMDSLDMVEIIMMLEERLQVEIPDEDIEHMRNYAQALGIVEAAVKKQR